MRSTARSVRTTARSECALRMRQTYNNALFGPMYMDTIQKKKKKSTNMTLGNLGRHSLVLELRYTNT